MTDLPVNDIRIAPAKQTEAEETLALQRLAYQSEARLYDDWSIPPLTQTLESLREEMASGMVFLSARADSGDGGLAGSVRARLRDGVCEIGRLVVHPDFQGRGIGSALPAGIERCFPSAVRYEVFTGHRSEANLRLYQRNGYVITHRKPLSPAVTLVFLSKPSSNVTNSESVS